MAFPMALQRKRSRIIMYSELFATFLSTVLTIIYCQFSQDYWGIIYGILINRVLITALSYRFYPEFRPRLHFDQSAARDIGGASARAG
jgi:hypothetical protein